MTTIPIDPKLFWGLFYFSCFGLAVIVAYGLLSTRQPSGQDPLDLLKSKFGASSVNDGLFLCAILLWAAIALSLTGGLLAMIWELIWYMAPATQGDDTALRFALLRLTAFTATLGAVIALPFTVIRLKLTSEQTNTATESLFNDKINAATDGLHAIRQISKRSRDSDGNKSYQTHWQDDITRRNAAIDRLEGLATDHPDSAPRISRLLSVYVRELSREYPPVETPKDVTPGELIDWARTLTVQRSDMENAVQVLGRLRSVLPDNPDAIIIDLNGANLQNFNLWKLDFQGAKFCGAQMQGAILFDAQMQVAFLSHAQMDNGTDLTAANLQAGAVRFMDFTEVPQIRDFVATMFGDGSVTLPPDTPWPVHWPRHELEFFEFYEEWEKWHDDPENYVSPVQQDDQTAAAAE